FVGYGTSANCAETSNAPAPSNVNSISRKSAGCTDSNDNSTDFLVGPAAPRNSGSPPNPCPSCPTIGIRPAFLPDGTVGVSYSQTLSATAGVPPFTFTLLSGSLPPALVLASNGELSGTTTVPGSFSFAVKAKDSNGCSGS